MNIPTCNSHLVNHSYITTAVSTVLTAIAPLVATLVDGLFASHVLGTDAFNAVNVVMPLVNAVSVLTMICNMGGSVLGAAELAKGNVRKANQIFTISLLSSVIVSLIVTSALAFFHADLSVKMSTGIENARCIDDYLTVLLAYFLLVPFTTSLNNFVSIEGNPRLTTHAVILANILNILLDIVFISFLGWGIKGAALATVASAVVNIAVFIPHFIKRRSRYRIVKLEAGKWQLLRENLKHGFAFNVFYIATNAFMILANNLISRTLGEDALTLYGVCLQIQSLTFAFTVGICIAGISLIGYLRGEGDREGVLFILSKTLNHVIIFYASLAALMTLFPQVFLAVFGLDGVIAASYARIPFICYSIHYFCFIAVYVTLSFQLSGRVGAKILFVFGISIATYICMRLFSGISPQLLWVGLPVGSIPVLFLALAYGYSLHLRNPLLSKFTVANTFPESVEISLSPKNTRSDATEVYVPSRFSPTHAR